MHPCALKRRCVSAGYLREDPNADARALAGALKAAAVAISDYGGAIVGDRTMLDALWPAAHAAHDFAREGGGQAWTVSLVPWWASSQTLEGRGADRRGLTALDSLLRPPQ